MLHHFECFVCGQHDVIAEDGIHTIFPSFQTLFLISNRPLCRKCLCGLKKFYDLKIYSIGEKIMNCSEIANMIPLNILGKPDASKIVLYLKLGNFLHCEVVEDYKNAVDKNIVLLTLIALENEIIMKKAKVRGYFLIQEVSKLTNSKESKIKKDQLSDHFFKYENFKNIIYKYGALMG